MVMDKKTKQNIAPHLSVWEEHDGVDVGLVALEGLHTFSLPYIPHLIERRVSGGRHGGGPVNESLNKKNSTLLLSAVRC